MPGFAALLNGQPTVARLDTGGSFIHVSSEAATAFGVKTIASEREFAALGWHTVRHGIANLELGPIQLRNVPVAVHEGALPAGAIAEVFGVELGPIIGTNVLGRFLTTVDAPSRRLLLSRRGDAVARAAHLAQLDAAQHEAPFALWSGRVQGSSPLIRHASMTSTARARRSRARSSPAPIPASRASSAS